MILNITLKESVEMKVKVIWSSIMAIILLLLVYFALIMNKDMTLLQFMGLGVVSGITFSGMNYHFKNISSYKGFKIFQFVFMVIFFAFVLLMSFGSEMLDNKFGVLFFIAFFAMKDFADYCIEGIEIVIKEPKKGGGEKRKKFSILILVGIILILLVIAAVKLGISSIPEWLSAFGTISAVLFSLWMVFREEKLNVVPYLHIPSPYPQDMNPHNQGDIQEITDEVGIINDEFIKLCIANKMKSNIQVRITYVRVIDIINKNAIFERDRIVEIRNTERQEETGYAVLPTGDTLPLLKIPRDLFDQDESAQELEVMLDFLDKGMKKVIIGSRAGELVILPKESVEVPIG